MNTDKVSEMLNNRILSEKAAYSDEGVALFESTDRMTTVRNVNIDALLLGLCQSGHATLTIDGVEHEVSTYDLLVCLPGMTISRSETSGDISGCCICVEGLCAAAVADEQRRLVERDTLSEQESGAEARAV